MNDLEKRGYSPQVQKALGEIIAVSSALNGSVPTGGVFAVGDRLAAWEFEATRDAQRHKQAMQSRVGHPALKRRH